MNAFQADCERFVVCLLLFSSPQLCILAFDAESETAAPFIMLEIMRQFSFQICRDFHDIFDKLDIVLAEHRCDKEHGRRMALLAYHTGLLHGAIVSYDEQMRANPNLVRPIFLLNFLYNHCMLFKNNINFNPCVCRI